MLDWLIIGGGIHGTHIALKLKAKGIHNFRILDPHPHLLENWKRCTHNTGMQYLRSPEVHHIGDQPFDLHKFISRSATKQKAYITSNHRPLLSLFNSYSDLQLETYDLNDLHVKAKATKISIERNGVSVDTDHGKISARRLILAIGKSNHLLWPDWASKLKTQGAQINHIFDPDFTTENVVQSGQKVIIGGGLSAAQLALRLLQNSDEPVIMCSPHPLIKNDYDTDPGWMGPKLMQRFSRNPSYTQRRNMISKARNVGAITNEIYRQLQNHLKKEKLKLHIAEVSHADIVTSDLILLNLKKEDSIAANEIILATGFEKQRPGGILVDSLVDQYGLVCAKCGYPIPKQTLEWGNDIFVTGPLAELEIGPASPNIIGARHAGERISTVF